jgi:peptidoglycan/xylan/chitin deacetylase (PgdA/CDA1 family)
MPALRSLARDRAVVLGYHGVADCRWRDDPFLLTISPRRFRQQLEMIKAAGFRFVTAADLAATADGGPPPPGLAVVTFDDAIRNNLTVAAPILRELGIRASLFVPTDWVGGMHPEIRGAEGEILSAAELRQLAGAGWEIGAHSATHPDMSRLDYADCLREVQTSCAAVEELTGTPVQTFAYPFGRYGEAAIAAVRDSGLLAALTTGSGAWNRFELTRAMIGAADPGLVIMLKVSDRYEPLLANAPLRVSRLASRRLRRRLGSRRRLTAPR